MPDLKKFLKNSIAGAKSIAVLGIGSEFRGDDAAGVLTVQKIDDDLKPKKSSPKIKTFIGATAPENLTGEIKRFAPSHIIIIDTVEMNEKPGTILGLDPDEVGEGVSFSTHKMPAKVLVDYFKSSFECKVVIIGIQPKNIDFGGSLSKEVGSAVKYVSGIFNKAVAESLRSK